ncbi:MAG: hypothetical protein M1830_003246 [Pleopsidium flavum]|nr:MAG: hypothetical protein M1830_003246 [Pleopsidium flavum]
MANETVYSPVADEKLSSDEDFNNDHDAESLLLPENDQRQRPGGFIKCRLPWIAHGMSILMCLSLLFYTNTIYNKSRRSCIEKFNAYSPLLDGIDEDYQDVRFKYSLWHKSPTKGPPTPQVEDAWHSIMQYGVIRVPASDILRIGHNLTAVQFPPSAGGGFPVIASGTHAIHCLHYIWQDHYTFAIPEVQTLKNEIPEMYERHYEHCVDYIRQYLMCKFDATVIPLNWVRDHQNPTPNGNTIHRCVNWDGLQSWLKDRAVELPEGFKWQQPADAVSLDENP